MFDILPERCRDYAEAYTGRANVLGLSLICIAFVAIYLITSDLYWLAFAGFALAFLIAMLYDMRRVKRYLSMRLVLNERSLDVRDIRSGATIQSIPYSDIHGVEVRRLRISDSPVRRRINSISEQTLVLVHHGDSAPGPDAANRDCLGIDELFTEHCIAFAHDEAALALLRKHLRTPNG